MVRQPDPTKLVVQFAEDVVLQTDAIWRGDHKTGNKHAKRYIATFQKLRTMGDVGRDALAALLVHERPDVRVMAAAFLLRHRTPDALDVLRDAARGSGGAAFGASEAIKRWEEGTWALDPEGERGLYRHRLERIPQPDDPSPRTETGLQRGDRQRIAFLI
ncbi:MAG: HEAT repeat domain-containing protein [Kofleriaceae bacterium]|nr:HEAT repeat domain-containing protein [Kofleriaceae bacterium]